MGIAALVRESLGRVPAGARQVTVDVAVDGFAAEASRLAGAALVGRPLLPQYERTLRWGQMALDRSRQAIGYHEVAAALEGVLRAMVGQEQPRG